MAMDKFRFPPLPNPPIKWDAQYMRQVLRVMENYFSQIDSRTPNNAQQYTADKFVGGIFATKNVTTAEKNALTPDAGWVVFDTDLEKLCVYSGSAWQTVTSV
jgi:hypothetical protein